MDIKKNNKKTTKEIIRRFYYDEYNPEIRQKVILSFSRWLTTKNVSEKYLPIFRELFDKQCNTVSNRVVQLPKTKALVERIKREYGNLTNTNEGATVDKTKRTTRLALSGVAMRIAAVLIPTMIVISGVWYINRATDVASDVIYAELNAANGETINSILPDNTKVWVNGGGKLTVSQSKSERMAELSGESYFYVTKNSERPFVVKTTHLTVTVFGTEFNVKAYPQSDVTIVTLNSGKVVVETLSGKSYVLEPNQQLVYTKSTNQGVVKTLEQFRANEVAEWTQGVLMLDNMSITDAVREMERHFGVTIEIQSGVSFDNIITLKCDSSAVVEDVIRQIGIIIPNLKHKMEGDKIVITKE